ncbi:cytochrome c oxidase assembly protein COX11, mitochondrial isoform X1 [Tripterygium wilfordii]|uniref:cytochrome c oxidase assembly protein COX11, mitochondrial isoform X1 n=2 Tax=Tripterygium wilfordii TaxID=458696 RepID=UPI0018F83CE8|nr:cytochrome c oxidase assembly protein COX11, mitochondrial isoform X1 [Tripterygium wilfordii]
MSLLRFSGRTHNLIKNLQHFSRQSRHAAGIQWPYYDLVGATRAYRRAVGYEIQGLMSRCEFSTSSRYRLPGRFQSPGFHSYSLVSIQRGFSSHVSAQKKSEKMLWYLVAVVFAMVGATYAAVPLYQRFCAATGYGGTIQRKETVEEKIARHTKDGTVNTREISVQFNADVADQMPWKFVPTQREVRVKPGESALAFYTAENRSSTPITGVSTYNVIPMEAAIYFNKIQCFCFEEQRLLPGEQIDMPVFFYIDPEFETDPKMEGINSLILSYTFFKVADK